VVRAIRLLLAVAGVMLFALGLVVLAVGGPVAAVGIWPLISGSVLLVSVVLERQRYRSAAAEITDGEPGPGGGEPAPLPSRFRPTEERFVDPTTGWVMRVYVESSTGERRYRAETDHGPR